MSKIVPAPLSRPLSAIGREIAADWSARGAGIYFGAVPYVRCMRQLANLDSIVSNGEDGADVVTRFLVNAGTWRGPVAQRVKAELRAALAHHAVATHEPSDGPYGAPAPHARSRRPLVLPSDAATPGEGYVREYLNRSH